MMPGAQRIKLGIDFAQLGLDQFQAFKQFLNSIQMMMEPSLAHQFAQLLQGQQQSLRQSGSKFSPLTAAPGIV